MSARVQALVWEVADLGAPERLVLLKLADCADDTGRNARPSQARLAAWCGLDVRTVRRVLDRLRSAGLIVMDEAADAVSNAPALYRVDLDELRAGRRADAEAMYDASPIRRKPVSREAREARALRKAGTLRAQRPEATGHSVRRPPPGTAPGGPPGTVSGGGLRAESPEGIASDCNHGDIQGGTQRATRTPARAAARVVDTPSNTTIPCSIPFAIANGSASALRDGASTADPYRLPEPALPGMGDGEDATGETVEAVAARLRDAIWGPLLDWLVERTGKPISGLRPLVGSWIGKWGEAAVHEALLTATTAVPVDPVAWIAKHLQRKRAFGGRGFGGGRDHGHHGRSAAEDRDIIRGGIVDGLGLADRPR